MFTLILVRHGQSEWNKENRFTGWEDVDVSVEGIAEAKRAARLLKDKGYTFDLAYTSVLKRAIRTLWIIQDDLDCMWIPTFISWRLNERHYGALQGLNKEEVKKQYGEEQFTKWRRGYDTPPPPLEENDPRNPAHDLKYKNADTNSLPLTESLKDTKDRFMPYWNEVITSEIKKGKKVLIVAHGNLLRALVKHLDNVSDKDIVELNIATGSPLVYELNENFTPIRHYYLDEESVTQ